MLFVSDAVALVKKGESLDALPKSLPDVYANYLRRVNPKVSGVENGISDEDMLRVAKVLAELALGTDCIPKEFTRDRGLQRLKTDAPDLPVRADPLRRLVANGVLLSKEVGATTFFRFALDPVAEFLAAEAHFDRCEGKDDCLQKLLEDSKNAQGFHNALLLTMQSRRTASRTRAGHD